MRVVAIVKRWIDVLAVLFLAWREHRRERRSLIIRDENGQQVLLRATPERDSITRVAGAREEPLRMTLCAGTALPADVMRASRDGFVVLELPADKIVTRRTSVPAQARDFLAGVIRNQIDRLSPWPVDQA